MSAVNSNPFADDSDDGDTPNFSNSRVVIDDAELFDLTEYPSSFNEGLTLHSNGAVVDDSPRTSEVAADENDRLRVVVTQPQRVERRRLPVYTLGWTSTAQSQFMTPASGLDFLTGVHEVDIQQTVRNYSSGGVTEKIYIVKVPQGETLYRTSENSTYLARLCCGSQRMFTMSLLDHTQQEAARFSRNTGCAVSWFPFVLQKLIIDIPGEVTFGAVKQDLSFSDNSFTIEDHNGTSLYRIFGPKSCSWTIPLDSEFFIVGGDGGGILGKFRRIWNNGLGDYVLRVTFPASGAPDKHKMFILGAAFLVEYMYFEHRRTSCLRIC